MALVSGLVGGVGLVSGLGCPVPAEGGPGGSHPLPQAGEAEALGQLEVEPHRERDWSFFPGDTLGRRDPSPPRTGHAHLRLPISGQSVQAWGPGSLWAPLGRPHIPPRCLHQLSVSRTTGPDSPPLAPVPSSAPSQGLRGAGPTQPASRRTRCCAPRHRGLAQPLNWVPPSRPLRRAAGHALLAFLHI